MYERLHKRAPSSRRKFNPVQVSYHKFSYSGDICANLYQISLEATQFKERRGIQLVSLVHSMKPDGTCTRNRKLSKESAQTSKEGKAASALKPGEGESSRTGTANVFEKRPYWKFLSWRTTKLELRKYSGKYLQSIKDK